MIDHNLLVTSGYLVPGVFNSFLLNYADIWLFL